MNYYAKTDIGKVRKKNQDQAAVSANSKEQVIAVVCDGMGGHRAGEIASRVTIDHIMSCFDLMPPFDNVEELKKWLKETIDECDEIVKKMALQNNEHQGMGTTVVVAVLMEDHLYLSHVGDSRAYVLQDGNLKQVTKDHTLVNELVDRGALTVEEAKHHLQKSVLTQAIGAPTELKPSMIELDFEDGLLLLCSDGLYNCLDNETIKSILLKDTKVVVKASELIDQANANGGRDNIGVAIIDNQGGR